jgi:hypothetical protein
MARTKKPCAPRRARRPAADETCTLAITIERNGLRLDLWTCSEPTPVVPERRGELRVAPLEVVEWIGDRDWQLFYVACTDEGACDSRISKPGWYFRAVECPVEWSNNDPVGPYATLEEARADVLLPCVE